MIPTGREVLATRGVRPLLAAYALGTGATVLQSTALLAHVYAITGSTLALGFVGLAEFVPAAVLVLVTGSVADRFERRRIAALAIGGEIVCSLALFAYARTDPTSAVPIFAIVVAFGVCRAFQAPAFRSIPPMVAPDHALSRVVAFVSIAWQGAAIVGPALGGLLFAVGPPWPYLTAAVIFAVAMASTLSIQVRDDSAAPDRSERPSLRSAVEGLAVIRRTPILLGAISLDLFAVLFGGAIALIPAIATERLGVGPVGQGWLRAGIGIGASICGVVLATRPVTRNVGRWLMGSVAVFGAATIVFGLTRSFWVAFVALGVLSAADMVSVFVRSTLVPLATPDATRGRVLAVEGVFIGASNELGAFESGVAASLLGTAPAVILGGVATLVVVGLWNVLFPDLVHVDRFEDVAR